ncbi:MAG: TrkH family potassium uptake protein [Rickettsiaceae bacterium H1]|nr:TrkH family potassium uptake protein [Rickettsiaceae bacterium H1]
MFGGCTGSTAGGIKIFRIIVLSKHSLYNIKHILSPHRVGVITINNHQLLPNTLSHAYSFFFIFVNLYLLFAIFLAMSGLDFATSLSSAAATITNSGPGIGNIVGPYGNYSSLSGISKWLLSLLMIIGRLEVFTVMAFIVLFKGK